MINILGLVKLAKFGIRYSKIKYFRSKLPIFGSADITNACNLKCVHCYWWKNWKKEDELTVEQWRQVARREFKERGVISLALCGGEPLTRPDVVKMFVLEEKLSDIVITNGTMPLLDLPVVYFISMDGAEKTHNKIRVALGKALAEERGLSHLPHSFWNVHEKVKENVKNSPTKNIIINMTVNNLNKNEVRTVVEDWFDYVKGMSLSFYTPFYDDDPLWIPYGEERTMLIDEIKDLKKEFRNFIAIPDNSLDAMKSGEWSKECAIRENFMTISLDFKGRIKNPCVLGSAEKGKMMPICEKCGVDCAVGMTVGLGGDPEYLEIYKNIFGRDVNKTEMKKGRYVTMSHVV